MTFHVGDIVQTSYTHLQEVMEVEGNRLRVRLVDRPVGHAGSPVWIDATGAMLRQRPISAVPTDVGGPGSVPVMRTFASGATRDTNADKLDYSGFLSPEVLEKFAQYMHKHRLQADGQMRASNNWQQGIDVEAYRESLIRHTIDWWKAYDRGHMEEADNLACAILFNVQGYLFERLKGRA